LSLLISTLVGAGMWAIIVVLPQAQRDFGVDRAAASLPYTLMMCTLAFSTIALGRMTDRRGIALPIGHLRHEFGPVGATETIGN
jgi:MFS family permease